MSIPKDAAAVILIRESGEGNQILQVFWARRSEKLAFLGGFYAFPGGQVDSSDSGAHVTGCDDPVAAAMINCAARELFEETGVLAARGSESLTRGQLGSLRDDLVSGRMEFQRLLEHFGLHLDVRDFQFAGRWVTPPFSRRRYDTWFFLVSCPRKQQPDLANGELVLGEWISPEKACEKWQRSEALIAPPVLHAVRTLALGPRENLLENFLSVPQAHGEPTRAIEFIPDFVCFPLLTPTKPPATHTNCYIVGSDELLVIDPGSPLEEEQASLWEYLNHRIAAGHRVKEILLTHHHPDHVGGVNALRSRLQDIPVAAHPSTAAAIEPGIRVDHLIEDGHSIEVGTERRIILQALHTPGHAPGHLSFYEELSGALIAGDNIVGFGTVLIDDVEGNMQQYLDSLERFRSLPKVSAILGAHGPACANPMEKISGYIEHRLEREGAILSAVREGIGLPSDIVARVYTDVAKEVYPLAHRSVRAHLRKLEADGLITRKGEDNFWQPADK